MKFAGIAIAALTTSVLALAACGVISTDEFSCGDHCADAGKPPPAVDASILDGGSEASVAAPDAGGADAFGLGDGHNGDKVIVGTETVNVYAQITVASSVGAGTIDIEGASAPYGAGDLVLVWQTSTGEPVADDLGGTTAGKYEFTRVASVTALPNGQRLALVAPLTLVVTPPGAQAVRVPEYKTLQVATTGRLTGKAWDGKRGGIVAVFSQASFSVDGTLDVSALGFRGATSYANGNLFNCDDRTDGTPVAGYAAKGEGLSKPSYQGPGEGDPSIAPGGRGNATVGGGGGTCHNAGGAGGGNGGAGGRGGRQYDSNGNGSLIGGIGGAALNYTVRDRIILGGGGGAGDRHGGIDTSGGAGGGALLVRAASFVAHGVISANGIIAPQKTDHDGAGGGGAGGTLALFIDGDATCDHPVQVTGGSGQSTSMSNVGPGGGGGGGHVLLTAKTSTCSFDVSSGLGGVQANATVVDGPRYGALPALKESGVIESP